MPLINGPTLTPKKLAANRANAQLSRGPITPEGLIRMRDSKMKHGAYAQDKEEALRALGEDPKDFEALLESLRASWQPANVQAWHARNQKMNIENEGESHDIVDNKGPDFLSHDVTHNKAT
ncbi:MAG TPA: hypothetical protein VMT20_27540 [Terriglobia bacterium]|nr:hypothetical protein [Terriglobia bacterium]